MSKKSIAKTLALIVCLAIGYTVYPHFTKPKNPTQSTTQEPQKQLRPIPTPNEIPTLTPLTPPSIYSGGTFQPLSAAIKNAPEPTIDQQGHAWTPIATAPLAQSNSLKDTSFYIIIDPTDAPTFGIGLLGGSNRNYDNFVMLYKHADGKIYIRSETTSGGASHSQATLIPDLDPSAPSLIEFHPQKNNTTNIFVNGHPAGHISSSITANVFGGGYSGSHFKGKLGHLSAHQNLTESQILHLRNLLLNYWNLNGKNPYPKSHLLHPTLATKANPTTTSDTLTLHLENPTEQTQTFISTSKKSPPNITELTRDLTVIQGQTWNIQTPEKTTATLSFTPTLLPEYLGQNGFYALLHRTEPTQPWQEIATTSLTKNNQANFPNTPLTTGTYTIGIIQGLPLKKATATLTVTTDSTEPTPIKEETNIPFGAYYTLTSTNPNPSQQITLTESKSGAIWYSGPIADLNLSAWLLNEPITLTATYSAVTGVLTTEKTFTINPTKNSQPLNHGLIAKIIQRHPNTETLPQASAFTPPANTTITNVKEPYKNYPLFRTGESIKTPPLNDVTTPWFALPSYHHLVLPTLSISADREKIIAQKSSPNYPIGDLAPRYNTSALFTGKLLIDQAGTHEFKLLINNPARLTIGEKTINLPANDTLKINLTAGTINIDLVIDQSKDKPLLESQLLWKPPGKTTFTPAPDGILVHPLDPIRQAAYQHLKGEKQNHLITQAEKPASLPALNLPAQVADQAAFEKAINPLTKTYQTTGNTTAAQQALTLIQARIQFLRENPKQLRTHQFSKVNGRLMQLHLNLLPFLNTCQLNPTLQKQTLAARADLNAHALAQCLSRSFFGEGHAGTNDGYGDGDNLIVNFWRAAAAIDSPYAYDAATDLMDSHFRYTAGRHEGLSADGIWNFHNANGRHIHMGGYGGDWFRRVAYLNRTGTPWGYTKEQHRRLTEYLLAYEWFFYHNTSSFYVNGRHNSHSGNVKGLLGYIKLLTNIPAEFFPEQSVKDIAAMKARIEKNSNNSIIGHRFFFRNLATVHRRADYYIDSKMISPLSGPSETFAGYRPGNMNFGDGTYTLMRTGNEYNNIHRNAPNAAIGNAHKKTGDYALWQYRALPGSTMCDDETFGLDRYRGGHGTTAGGTSDGSLGNAAFQSKNHKTATDSHKFYAYTEDGLAVLNTAINFINRSNNPASNPRPDCTIRSNINQCDWTGTVTIQAQGGETKTIQLDSPDQTLRLKLDRRYLVTHAGIAYLILPTGNESGTTTFDIQPKDPMATEENKPRLITGQGFLELKLQNRNTYTQVPGTPAELTNVKKLIAEKKSTYREAKIFHLSIDHGPRPVNASCAYLISIRAENIDPQKWLTTPPITIHSNTIALQSLTDTRDQTTHAFFRQAGELKNAESKPLITTTSPAAILWNKQTNSITVQDNTAACLTDHTKMINTIQATLHPNLTGKPTPQEIAIPLQGANDPDDRYRGKPTTKKL